MTTTAFTIADLRAGAAAAVRAPSLHNCQPWRFRLRNAAIEVRLDPERRLPACDPTGWAARLACGAALFNLQLALAVAGTPAEARIRPLPAEPDLVASLTPGRPRLASAAELLLHAAIPHRKSNRTPFRPTPVPTDLRRRLTEAAHMEGAWLEMIIGAPAVGAVAVLTDSAHRVLRRDPGYRAELHRWTRDAMTDRVPSAVDAPLIEPPELLSQRCFGPPLHDPGRDFAPEPLVAVLGSAADTASDQVAAGRALQRVLLTATNAGLAVSMLAQSIKVPSAREQLRLALGRNGAPQMVMRIGYGEPGWPTPRRSVDDVLDFDDQEAPHNWGATSAATSSR